MRHLYALALSVPLVTALAVHQGCGSGEDTIAGPGTAANGTGASAASGGVGHGGSAAAGAVGGGTGAAGLVGGGGNGTGADAGVFDADFGYDAPAFDAGLEDACVDETAAADPVPLDIYFMLDRSGSMSTDCDVTWPQAPDASSRWCHAINAIAGYIQDPQSNGNRAALEFFSGSISEQCNGAAYATPAVNLVDLTAQAGQLITAMDNQAPGGTTPTEAALRGLAAFTTNNQTPGRVIIGILITDGDPCCYGTCEEDDPDLADIVEDHYNATGIHTFIVGMSGVSFASLEEWASYPGALLHDDTNNACGTCNNCNCHHYNVGDGDAAVFIWALQQIQNSVLGCTFNVPNPGQGVLDPDLVTVEYSVNGQPPPEQLVEVDAGLCTGADDEWYYDDYDVNNMPTTINMCPATCSRIQLDSNAQIQIRIACQGS